MAFPKLHAGLFAAALAFASVALHAITLEGGPPSGSSVLEGGAAKSLTPPATDAAQRFTEGVQALRNNDLHAAAAHFGAAALAAPQAPGPELGLAEVARRRGDLAGAETHIARALKVAPAFAPAHVARAHLLVAKKDYPGAAAELDKAIELDPRAVAPRVERGDLYATVLGDRSQAIEAYRDALKLDSDNAAAHYGLGAAYGNAGKYAEAKVELERATQLAPGNAPGWVALGAVDMALGDRDAALAAYERALKVAPDYVPAHVARGDVLAVQGRFDDAIAEYELAQKASPRSTILMMRLGAAHDQAHRSDEAERQYRAVLALEPRNAVAANNLAFLLAENKRDLDEALRLANVALQAPAPSDSTWDTLAWVRRARGELAEAAKILEPRAAKTKDPAIAYHLGVVYADMGRKRDAATMFDKALKLAPNYPPAQEARRKLASD